MTHRTSAGRVWLALLIGASLSAQASGGVLSSVGVIPDPFSPNGDGSYDSTAVHYELSDTAAVIVSVADSSLAEIETLWSGWEGSGAHRHFWDGVAGTSVADDGEYAFVITVVPEAGGLEEAVARFRLDTAAPVILALEAEPARFSPDGDGVGDTLFVWGAVAGMREGDRVRVRAYDSAGSLVRVVLAPTGADSFSASWDGRNAAGSVQADGLYLLAAEAWDMAANSARASLLVDLDTAPPLLGVEYTDADEQEVRVADTLAVLNGWAYDRAGVRSVELSLDGVAWTVVGTSGADTVRWADTLACPSCTAGGPDETVTVHVRAHDGAATADGEGHVNASGTSVPPLLFPVVFDTAGPDHEASSIQGGSSVFAPGQTITVSTEWDAAGYDIEGDFSRVDSEFEPDLVQITDSGGGTYQVRYTTSAVNSFVPVTGARIVITATDGFERAASDSSLTVTIRPDAPESDPFTVDRNSFDPSAGERAAIGLDSGASKVEVFSMAGALVRTIEADEETYVEWDGRNDDGEVVASGVYFLRIQTGADEAVRKVAVVK